MAKKSNSDKITWRGYINITIPSAQSKQAKAYIADDKSVFADYTTLLTMGYTVKFQRKHDSESIQATLYCGIKGHDNAGYSLSAWGSDWFVALGAVLYKHYHVAQGLWGDYSVEDDSMFG